MEHRQIENTDVPMADVDDDETLLLNYHLVFPDRNGLSYDALFNLALVVDHITVDAPMEMPDLSLRMIFTKWLLVIDPW